MFFYIMFPPLNNNHHFTTNSQLDSAPRSLFLLSQKVIMPIIRRRFSCLVRARRSN